MDKWTEYDPETGIKETTVDAGESLIIHKSEDVQDLLDRNAALRADKATDIGIKKGLWHYASIPLTVQYELLKKGINIFLAQDHKRAFDEINANYPHLKTTEKTHSIGRKRSRTKATSTQPGILLSGN